MNSLITFLLQFFGSMPVIEGPCTYTPTTITHLTFMLFKSNKNSLDESLVNKDLHQHIIVPTSTTHLQIMAKSINKTSGKIIQYMCFKDN